MAFFNLEFLILVSETFYIDMKINEKYEMKYSEMILSISCANQFPNLHHNH